MSRKRLPLSVHQEKRLSWVCGGALVGALAFVGIALLFAGSFEGISGAWGLGGCLAAIVGAVIGGSAFDSRYCDDD